VNKRIIIKENKDIPLRSGYAIVSAAAHPSIHVRLIVRGMTELIKERRPIQRIFVIVDENKFAILSPPNELREHVDVFS
jgi:hypothetical protein